MQVNLDAKQSLWSSLLEAAESHTSYLPSHVLLQLELPTGSACTDITMESKIVSRKK